MHTPRSPSSSGSLSSIVNAAKRSALNVPIRLMPTTISNGWSWCGPREEATRSGQPTPAQCIEMRSPPSACAACLTAASTSSGLVTSALTKSTPISSASALPFSSLRSAMVTCAPRSDNARAVASPSPEAPPTTSAPLPLICMARDRINRLRWDRVPAMDTWNLTELDVEPHHPEVLRSDDGAARAIALHLPAGEKLQHHQVYEHTWLHVHEGEVEIGEDGRTTQGGPGFVAHFDPHESREVRATSDARLLLILAPWPGEGRDKDFNA